MLKIHWSIAYKLEYVDGLLHSIVAKTRVEAGENFVLLFN